MNSLITEATNMLKVGSWGSMSRLFDAGDQFLSDNDNKTGSLSVDSKILGDENRSDQVGFDHLDFLDDYLTYSAPKNGEKLANSSTDENDMDFPEWLENKIDFSLLDNFDNIERILDDPNLVMEDDEFVKLSDDQLDEKQNVPLIDKVENETSKARNISLNLSPSSPPYSTPSSPEGLVPDNSPPCSPLIGSPPSFGNLLIANQIFPSPIFSTVPTTFTIILPDGNLAGLLTNVVNEEDVIPNLEIFETNSQISDISDSSRVLTKIEDQNNDCIEIFEESSEISELSQNEGFLPIAREASENNFEGILNDKQNTVQKEGKVVKAKRGRKRKNPDAFSSNSINSDDYSPPVPKQRKERKRMQNKDAATRYRQKKRAEAEAIGGVEEKLLDVNKTLKDKAQQLSSEISYLKGLMREMFKARGLLK